MAQAYTAAAIAPLTNSYLSEVQFDHRPLQSLKNLSTINAPYYFTPQSAMRSMRVGERRCMTFSHPMMMQYEGTPCLDGEQ